MKRKPCILIVAAACSLESMAVAAPSLQTQLSCETNVATAQATVVFTWRIENVGDAPVHLLNHFAYASRGPLLSLRFIRQGQKPVTVEFDMRDCITWGRRGATWGSEGTKILTLAPKETFELRARANLRALGPLAVAKYSVTALYEPRGWAWELLTEELRKNYDLRPADIWNEELKSNELELAITE